MWTDRGPWGTHQQSQGYPEHLGVFEGQKATMQAQAQLKKSQLGQGEVARVHQTLMAARSKAQAWGGILELVGDGAGWVKEE